MLTLVDSVIFEQFAHIAEIVIAIVLAVFLIVILCKVQTQDDLPGTRALDSRTDFGNIVVVIVEIELIGIVIHLLEFLLHVGHVSHFFVDTFHFVFR